MDSTAEVFDQFQQFCDVKGFNDHQVHCVLRFEYLPDAAILKKAVISSIEAIPILGADIVTDANSAAIAESIILLGRALGLSVIAEGVESVEQRDALVRLGCSSFQGWLFRQALPVEEFQSFCQAA
jgi:predicted signal transduction protein with EAL and GGDEF domain